MPAKPDDPEITERLAALGWKAPDPIPPLTRLAAYGVVRRDGALLLARVGPGSIGEGLWVLPGGRVEFGERPEAAAVREVEEETGLVGRIAGPPSVHSDTGVWPFSGGPVRYHHIRIVYPMAIVGGTERAEVAGSSDAFGWFTKGELETLPIGDLVRRVLTAERGSPATAGES